MDENDAFCQIVDRHKDHKAIFIADREFESYNGFEHVVKSGNKYLIRVKDIHSRTSMVKSLGPFPDGEFDIDVSRVLTLKNTNMVKACPHYYKWCPKNMRFDYMSKEDPWYEFKCRIVRFKITETTYECIITNLDRDKFPIENIKKLYNKRWGIETSFRQVKYAIGLNVLHSKKRELIQQEIYARLTLYNLTQRTVQKVKIPKKERKYTYQVNFTRACHFIRKFLNKKDGKTPSTSQPNTGYLIEKMEAWQKENYEAIIVVTCSADLSGTNNGFHLAKDTVGLDNVYIYDSRQVGAPVMDMAIRAKQLADEGKDVDEIFKVLEEKTKHSFSFLYPDNFDQLSRSGRLSPMAARMASMLKIKALYV